MALRWQDLLALAVKMEEDGRDFYRRQAALAKDAETRQILHDLLRREKDAPGGVARQARRGLALITA